MRLGGTVGGIGWRRIVESEGPDFDVFFLLPDASEQSLAPHRAWLEPRFLDPVSDRLVMAMQSYLLTTRHHAILVDACVGNDKERRFHAPWARRTSTRFLDNLAAAGLAPEDVDFVMCTHLHADHVGWNTRLLDGRWVPTFPNARYVFARTEYDHWIALNEGGKKYSDGCIDDSVLPVVEAGQAEIVDDFWAFDDEIRFAPTPGHTPGHVAIELRSQGARAVLSGDVCHTPLQCREPGWSAVGCSDRARSAATRRAFLERHADTDTLVMTAHFPSPSVGFVRARGDAFDFSYDE
ncbi:MAG: MBL fold metallo-hydrolase [Defluviicoccus sp.]|nr:MBL fold metallo-hydrolase [Defluviicoccus sp.]